MASPTPWVGTAGDTIGFECPAGSTATFKTGQFLPNEEKSILYVISQQNGKYVLGPTQAGKVDGLELCTPVTEAGKLSYELLLPKGQMPQPSPPLPPLSMPFPWLWLVKWFLIYLALALSGLFAFIIWRRKKAQAAIPKKPAKKKLSPEENLRYWLSVQKSELPKIQDNLALQKEIFFEGLRRLRRFLESRFEFFVPGATSREFVVELKSTLLVRKQKMPTEKLPNNISARVESLVSQADEAVYAQNRFDPKIVSAFVEQIRQIHKELATPPPEERAP